MRNLTVVVVTIILAVAGLVFWQTSSDESKEASTSETSQNESTAQQDETDQTSTPTEAASDTESAKLKAVGTYAGTGTATRTTQGQFVHEIIANLGSPADGDFYEGWLVGSSVVSTGKLVEEGEGQWSLTFTSDEDLFGHDQVVITEETEANGLDGVPEDHVLEGSF